MTSNLWAAGDFSRIAPAAQVVGELLCDEVPVLAGDRVLDVGCGTGAFIAALIGQPEYARTVVGVELSPELAQCARSACPSERCTVYQTDFLEWTPPAHWQSDTVVMSTCWC